MIELISARRIAGLPGRVPARARFLAFTASSVLFAALAAHGEAHADTLVLAESGLIIGQGTDSYSFDASNAGTLSLTLTDFKWPTNSFTDLTLQIASASGILETLNGSGQASVQLSGPGTYYAYVTGTAGASSLGINMGAFGLTGTLTSPVPLPTSISLLLAGGLAMLWSMRRRAKPQSALLEGARMLLR